MTLWLHDFSNGKDLQSYAVLISFWYAIRERGYAVSGSWNFPRSNFVWNHAPITSIDADASIVTASSETWMVHPYGEPGGDLVPRWTGWTVPDEASWMPTNYDVILGGDDRDPTRHVHLQIADNDNTTLTVNSGQRIKNFVTAGYLPSVDWLVGKSLSIIKRGGIWWGERWPRQPNDEEHWIGSGTGVTLLTLSGDGWVAGSYAGKVIAFGPEESPTFATTIYESDGSTQTIAWSDDAAIAEGETARIMDGETVLATGTVTSIEDGVWATDAKLAAGVGAEDEEILVYSAGVLLRIAVERYTATTVVFERQDVATFGPWSVVSAGGRAWPGAEKDTFGLWYGGADRGYVTHLPTGTLYDAGLASVRMPVTSIIWGEGDGITCEDVSHFVFDLDAWSGVQELCSEADRCYSPDLYKTIRQMQITIQELRSNFVPPVDYAGAKRILPYSMASLFKFAGINYVGAFVAHSSTTTPLVPRTGVAAFEVGDFPDGVYYDLIRSKTGERWGDGFLATTDSTLVFEGLENDEDYELIAARGWTRWVPRRFAHAYPRSGFIPDIKADDFGVSAVVPGTHEYPGTWIERAPSSAPRIYDGDGFAVEGGTFEAGKRYRYMGDDEWINPSVEPRTPTTEAGPDTPYYRNMWLGEFHRTLMPAFNALKRGVALYGGPDWLMTPSPRWYGSPIGNGLLDTISGTASSGSATTLIDMTQFVEDEDTGVVSMDGRWGQYNRWVGNILEVTRTLENVDGDEVTVVTRTRITGQPGGASEADVPTIIFAAVPAYTIPEVPATETTPLVPAIEVPALTVTDGTAYAIREPATRRNWWRGRTIRITSADGSETAERTIRHHDDQAMWWDGDVEFDLAGATFEIVELQVGGVYMWDGAKWVPPTDNVKGLPLTHLLETLDTRYGLMHNGDALAPMLAEMYRAINALVWTVREVAWTNDPDGPGSGSAVPNYVEAYASDASDGVDGSVQHPALILAITNQINGYHDDKDDVDVPPIEPTLQGGAPYLKISSQSQPTASFVGYEQRAALPVVTAPSEIAREIEVVAYGMIAGDDPDEVDVMTLETHETGGKTYISEQYENRHFNAHSTPLMWRQYASLQTFAAGTIETQYGNWLGMPVVAAVPEEHPGYWGVLIYDTPTEQRGIGGGFAVEGFVIRDAVALVKWDVPGGFEYVAP